MNDLIFLIGFRAVGKTTIGRSLAAKLGFEFFDTDSLVCRREDASVREIVAAHGWQEFRRLEEEALYDAAKGHRRVIATGGGAVLHRKFWKKTRGLAFVVWLSADLKTLAERLRQDNASDELRPSLTGADICAEIKTILTERTPLYRSTAHLEVDTANLTITEAVEKIRQIYEDEGW